MGTSVFLSMEDAAARDHERTINSLTEASSAHTVLHWPQRTREGKKVWTQSWPNIIRVNGKKANFSLVRDITAEKERDFLLEGVFAAQRKERHQSYQELLTMFAGRSAVMGQTMENLLRAALSLVTVSIYGETGTGKSLAARLVHQLSSKADGPFTYVNCSAIPDELFESSFFGHVKGAFTGAIRDAEGFLTKADQGTLFLDEVGELPLPAQGSFLRALEQHRFRPVGEVRESASDFRLVAATNRNLDDMADMDLFRSDLRFRLRGMHIHVPRLRRRLEDIPALASHIIENCCRRNGIPPKEAGQDVLDMLSIYPWPGNVRELKHAMERACAASGSGRILARHLPTEIRISLAKSRLSFPGASFGDAPSSSPSHPGLTSHEAGDLLPSPQQIPHQARQDSFPTLRESRARADAEYLEPLLARFRGDVRRAASAAGISRGHLYELLKKHGLARDGADSPDCSMNRPSPSASGH